MASGASRNHARALEPRAGRARPDAAGRPARDGGALPGSSGENYSFEVRWTLAAVVVAVWIGCGAAAYRMITRVLYLAANLLGALHEGDYSIRAAGAKPGSAVDLVMKEINSLGDTLQRQRIGGGGIDGAAHERDGRDRRRGIRLRHGRVPRSRQSRSGTIARQAVRAS